FEVGPRDVDGGAFVAKRRLDRSKETVTLAAATPEWLRGRLEDVHTIMYEKAREFRDASTRDAATYDEMKKILAEQGGFVRCWFTPNKAIEARIKEETKATVRCIPFNQPGGTGKDVYTGDETGTQVLFAQAY